MDKKQKNILVKSIVEQTLASQINIWHILTALDVMVNALSQK